MTHFTFEEEVLCTDEIYSWLSICEEPLEWVRARVDVDSMDDDWSVIDDEDDDWLSPAYLEDNHGRSRWECVDPTTLTNNQEQYFQHLGLDPFVGPYPWEQDEGADADTEESD